MVQMSKGSRRQRELGVDSFVDFVGFSFSQFLLSPPLLMLLVSFTDENGAKHWTDDGSDVSGPAEIGSKWGSNLGLLMGVIGSVEKWGKREKEGNLAFSVCFFSFSFIYLFYFQRLILPLFQRK